MVLMAGMLPGVECARRRRLRQSSGGAEAPCGTRRPSLCLYAGGSDHAHLGSSTASKERSSGGVCKEMSRAWTLDSNAREAKERLDQKLRGQRESVVKRHLTSTGTVRPPAAKPQAANTSSGCKNLHHPATAGTAPEAGAAPCVLQREVFSKPRSGGGAPCWRRRFSWGRSRPAEAEEWECAVWCAWRSSAEGTWWRSCPARTASTGPGRSRCPVCRAQVHLASSRT